MDIKDYLILWGVINIVLLIVTIILADDHLKKTEIDRKAISELKWKQKLSKIGA